MSEFPPIIPPEEPFELFDVWFAEAKEKEGEAASAMMLATVGKDGFPAARAMMMKSYDKHGFVF